MTGTFGRFLKAPLCALWLGLAVFPGCSPQLGAKEKAARRLQKEEDPAVRADAILSLKGVATQASVPILIDALKDRDQGVRLAALYVLRPLGSLGRAAFPAVEAATKDREVYIRLVALETVGAVAPEPERAVLALVAAFKDPERMVRLKALAALRDFRAEARTAVPAIVSAIPNSDEEFRLALVRALSLFEADPAITVPALAGLVGNGTPSVRVAALQDLQGMARAQGAVPAAIAAMAGDVSTRIVALQTLRRVAVPAVIEAMKAADESTRLLAVQTLATLGASPLDAVPALEEAAQDPSPVVSNAAQQALRRMPDLRPPLDRLDDPNPRIRLKAIQALGRMPPEEAVPALVRALADEDWEKCGAAVRVLGGFGPRASVAIPALIRLLESSIENEYVRREIGEALANVGGVRASLVRGMCFGTCPSYAVTIYIDGTVLYQGGRFVKVQGARLKKLSPTELAALEEAFEKADYFSLRDSYRGGSTDCPSTQTSFTREGRTKSLEHNMCAESAPQELTWLEERIDEVSDSVRWVGTDTEREAIERARRPEARD